MPHCHILERGNTVCDDLLREVGLFGDGVRNPKLAHVVFSPAVKCFLSVNGTGVIGATADLVKDRFVHNCLRAFGGFPGCLSGLSGVVFPPAKNTAVFVDATGMVGSDRYSVPTGIRHEVGRDEYVLVGAADLFGIVLPPAMQGPVALNATRVSLPSAERFPLKHPNLSRRLQVEVRRVAQRRFTIFAPTPQRPIHF